MFCKEHNLRQTVSLTEELYNNIKEGSEVDVKIYITLNKFKSMVVDIAKLELELEKE